MAKILYFVTNMEPMSISFALEHKESKVGICLLQDAVYFGCKGKRVNGKLAKALKQGIPVFVT
ncbi:unnamed protein product, partial [marine sediment metagenome]